MYAVRSVNPYCRMTDWSNGLTPAIHVPAMAPSSKQSGSLWLGALKGGRGGGGGCFKLGTMQAYSAVGSFGSGMTSNLRPDIVLPVAVIPEHRQLWLHWDRLSPHIDAGLQAILDSLLTDEHDECVSMQPRVQ